MRHGRPRQRLIGRPQTSPRSSTYAHENWSSIHTHTPLRRTSTTGHLRPHAPTKLWAPNCKVESHVSGNLGQPSCVLGNHEVLDGHTLVWSPIKFVESHAIVWTSSARLPWASTKFYGRSHIRLDGHENLWTLRRLRGCPKCRHRWASTHIHGCPTTAIPWAPNYVSNFTHFGRPLRYGWSPTSFTLDSHKTIWATTKCYGRPTNAVLDAHEVLWTATRYYGCPRYACGHPAKRILGAHTLYCVRPR